MKELIKYECERAFKSKSFMVCMIAGTCIVGLDFYFFYSEFGKSYLFNTVGQSWIGLDFQFMFNSLYYVLILLLAVVPYGASYYWDIKSGYIKNICVLKSRKEYYFAKSMVAFANAFVVAAFPLFLNLLVCMMTFPLDIPERLNLLGSTSSANAFSGIYYYSTFLYALCFIVIDGVIAGMASLLCICIAEYTESMFMTLAFPFAIYLVTSVGLFGINSTPYAFYNVANPWQRYAASELIIILILLVCLVAVSLGIFVKARRKDFL